MLSGSDPQMANDSSDCGRGHFLVKSPLPLPPDLGINLAAADNVIEALFASNEMPADWMKTTIVDVDADRGVFASDDIKEPGVGNADALWFELTETFESEMAEDSNFGLDVHTLGDIAHQFSKDERMPDILKYELTEDLGDCETDWHDSDFGFSDQQLETLWKRFGAHMGSMPSDDNRSHEFITPAPKALETVEEEEDSLPCTQALETVEETLENLIHTAGDVSPTKLSDFIGQETLEQFIGESVPELPRTGMRAWMLSTHNFDDEDWYLFKVNEREANRFYMKTFSDFEELHTELQRVTKSSGGDMYLQALPELAARDFFGVRRFFGGADFDAQRATQLRTYVSELMSRSFSPLQEQVLRLFFGQNARGRIMPPKGPIHRGMVYGL